MLKDIQVLNEKETRGGLEKVFTKLENQPNVVVLTADLAGSLKLGHLLRIFRAFCAMRYCRSQYDWYCFRAYDRRQNTLYHHIRKFQHWQGLRSDQAECCL